MKERESFSKKIYLLFNLFMILLYACAGILLIFVWPPAEILPEFNRIGLGIVLLIYSVYRGYKIYRKQTIAQNISGTHEQ
ncbi:MAG: hypothetical protein EYC69_14600 [Bacteroidetes bacterium]|nr:MAG: hypothetical protein EYC69_14600 [Bacteroidota bacterium]